MHPGSDRNGRAAIGRSRRDEAANRSASRARRFAATSGPSSRSATCCLSHTVRICLESKAISNAFHPDWLPGTKSLGVSSWNGSSRLRYAVSTSLRTHNCLALPVIPAGSPSAPTTPPHPFRLTRLTASSDTRFAPVHHVLSTPPSVVLSASWVNTRALSA